ncbi:hypothetical protein [Chitinibacter sp. GC72]|uniref:hypothetical protein n=1 Tax=Chitinibacter sp. GC72 TaxID=1526917 RepID=UPI0012F9901D|nr:hypothetical protein [Chitinibacter sp. GC72]
MDYTANIFDKLSTEKLIKGYYIDDCAIFREAGFGFLLIEEDPGTYYTDDHGDIIEFTPNMRCVIIAADKPINSRFNGYQFDYYSINYLARGTAPSE